MVFEMAMQWYLGGDAMELKWRCSGIWDAMQWN